MNELLDRIEHAIRSYRFRFSDEAQLQEGVERALGQEKIPYERERKLGRDRVDFLVMGVAVEIKVDGSVSDVTRQIHRYSEHPDVNAVILVTARKLHDRMPEKLSDKPVRVIVIGFGGY